MRIQAMDAMDIPQETLDELGVVKFVKPDGFYDILPEADYVSVHVPLTKKTRHLIDANAMLKMKSTAVVINVARGDIIDEEALVDALLHNKIRGAGLDVFSEEPVDPKHPLLKLVNVAATPHIAGSTTGTSVRRAQLAIDNINRLARGEQPEFLVVS